MKNQIYTLAKKFSLTVFASIILLIYALMIVSVSSCKSTKLTNFVSTRIQIDTVREIRITERFNAVHDTLIIDNPCDSSGILTTFYSRIVLPQGKIVIRSLNGKINTTVDIDSIKNVYNNIYKTKQSSDIKSSEKVITKTVYPAWLIVAVVFETLIILGYIYLKVSLFIK
jgi:hypothetical protein